MQQILRPFLGLVLIILHDFSYSNDNETKMVLGDLSRVYQQVSNSIKENQVQISEDNPQIIESLENLKQKLLEIDALFLNSNPLEICGKIEQHLLDIKTSIILMMYQAKRFTEFPDVKSRIESLLSETNQEILQQEELLNCGSRRELTEKDISVEKTTAGPLDEEFFSSVEGFRDRMQQARTDEVVAPLPPIAGQPENSREQGGSKNESVSQSQRKPTDSETESSDNKNRPSKSEELDRDCGASEQGADETCGEREIPEEQPGEADPEEPKVKSTPEVTEDAEDYNTPDYDENTDDIVARQIREAAMSEKDPELRKKLWTEYEKYKESL
ncbi:hypothetical protein OA067_02375 [Gammaproteobacteria bacterium]|nr:hypothetical protein [Gammaproteobacteria bacterium]